MTTPTNNIEHVLFKAYEGFLSDLAPSNGEPEVKDQMGAPIDDLFLNQTRTDNFKRALGPLFKPALRLYFERFLLKDKVDFKRLKYGIEPYKANILRRIGRDRLAYLKLLIEIHEAVKGREERKGLLLGDAS